MRGDLHGVTECSHGWQGWHCVQDKEGSCPFPADGDAECRCRESEYLTLRNENGVWVPIDQEATDADRG